MTLLGPVHTWSTTLAVVSNLGLPNAFLQRIGWNGLPLRMKLCTEQNMLLLNVLPFSD